MKKFLVTIVTSYVHEIEIEADSIDSAKEIAEDKIGNMSNTEYCESAEDFYIDDINVIEYPDKE